MPTTGPLIKGASALYFNSCLFGLKSLGLCVCMCVCQSVGSPPPQSVGV